MRRPFFVSEPELAQHAATPERDGERARMVLLSRRPGATPATAAFLITADEPSSASVSNEREASRAFRSI